MFAYNPAVRRIRIGLFSVTENVIQVTNVTRQRISGKWVTVTSVTPKAVGSAETLVTELRSVSALSVDEERWGMFSSTAVWADIDYWVASIGMRSWLFTPSWSGYALRTGNYRLVASYPDGSYEVVATSNSLGAPPPSAY